MACRRAIVDSGCMDTTTRTRITRNLDDRIIGGVASGLARGLDLPTWLIRLAFFVTTFAGGFGLAAYLVGLALMPRRSGDEAPADGLLARLQGRDATISIVGLVLLALALAIVLPGGLFSGPIVLAALIVAGAIALQGNGTADGETPAIEESAPTTA